MTYRTEYNETAVEEMIRKDRRIRRREAKRIHALLKGWRK